MSSMGGVVQEWHGCVIKVIERPAVDADASQFSSSYRVLARDGRIVRDRVPTLAEARRIARDTVSGEPPAAGRARKRQEQAQPSSTVSCQ